MLLPEHLKLFRYTSSIIGIWICTKNALISAVCGIIGLFSVGRPSLPPVREWGLAVGISCLGLLQQYCLIYAVTLESPARVTIVRQMQIVLAYIVQVKFIPPIKII